MAKDLSKVKILGQMSVFGLIYIMMVLFSQSIMNFDHTKFQLLNMINFDIIKICTCFTSCLYAFNSVKNVFSCVQMINYPSKSRINKMV